MRAFSAGSSTWLPNATRRDPPGPRACTTYTLRPARVDPDSESRQRSVPEHGIAAVDAERIGGSLVDLEFASRRKAFGHAVMEGADVILNTLYKTLVTPPTIRYRCAHGDARRGFRGDPDADRGGRRALVAAHGGADIGAARLAVSVRTGAGPCGDGTGSGGGGGSARRRVAPGRAGRPFPSGPSEDTARQGPGQAQGGDRGGQGGPPRGERCAVLPVGSGAAGEAAFGSRCRFAQAQHDHVAAHGSLPAARSLAGAEARQGHDQGAAWGSRFPEPGERAGCARLWSGRRSRGTRSRRCAGRSRRFFAG